jgi:hypothetical protein
MIHAAIRVGLCGLVWAVEENLQIDLTAIMMMAGQRGHEDLNQVGIRSALTWTVRIRFAIYAHTDAQGTRRPGIANNGSRERHSPVVVLASALQRISQNIAADSDGMSPTTTFRRCTRRSGHAALWSASASQIRTDLRGTKTLVGRRPPPLRRQQQRRRRRRRRRRYSGRPCSPVCLAWIPQAESRPTKPCSTQFSARNARVGAMPTLVARMVPTVLFKPLILPFQTAQSLL